MTKSVITGGAGFIGSHLVERLLAEGDEVTVLDDLSTGSLSNLRTVTEHPRLRFIEGSILDKAVVQSTIHQVDRVFHLAAAVGVELIVNHPLDSLRTNIHGTETVLQACGTRAKVMARCTQVMIQTQNLTVDGVIRGRCDGGDGRRTGQGVRRREGDFGLRHLMSASTCRTVTWA